MEQQVEAVGYRRYKNISLFDTIGCTSFHETYGYSDTRGPEHVPVIISVTERENAVCTKIPHIPLFLNIMTDTVEYVYRTGHVPEGFARHTKGVCRKNVNRQVFSQPVQTFLHTVAQPAVLGKRTRKVGNKVLDINFSESGNIESDQDIISYSASIRFITLLQSSTRVPGS